MIPDGPDGMMSRKGAGRDGHDRSKPRSDGRSSPTYLSVSLRFGTGEFKKSMLDCLYNGRRTLMPRPFFIP